MAATALARLPGKTPSRSGGQLQPLDRQVIALARADGLASIARPRRLGGMLARAFGLGRRNRLADPRLEALRVYAVRCWRSLPGASSRYAHEIVAHGYSPVAVLREIGRLALVEPAS